MNEIIKNVECLVEKYGDRLNSNQKLYLAYINEFENVEMNKKYINVEDFLNVETSYCDIVGAKYLISLFNEGD